MKTRQAQGTRLTYALRPIDRSAVPKSQYNSEHEYDASPASRPYVLWFETLPSGDTAKVVPLPAPHPLRRGGALEWEGEAGGNVCHCRGGGAVGVDVVE